MNFLNIQKICILLVALLCMFGFGFLSGVFKTFPYNIFKELKEYLGNYSGTLGNSSSVLKKCKINTTDVVMEGSSVIIGHAYGSPYNATKEGHISPKIEKFLSSHSNKLQRVIFTGDVFYIPSIAKWSLLEESYPKLEIHVAPGNHDVLRLDSRDVFHQSKFGKNIYPYQIEFDGSTAIISDSVKADWNVSDKTISLINNSKEPKIIVARHNIPAKELRAVSNKKLIPSGLSSLEQLKEKVTSENQIYWIMGDGGAFSNLPRLACFSSQNHTFIVNGIGEEPGDKVLLIHNEEIYQYSLN